VNRLISILLPFILILPVIALATTTQTSTPANDGVHEKEKIRRLRVLLAPELVYLKDGASSLSGLGIGASIQFGLHKKWAVGAGARQVFNSSGGMGAFLSEIEFKLTYSITGSLVFHETTTSYGSHAVIEGKDFNAGGLRAHAFLVQYYFHTTNSARPYSGLGGALSYEFSSNSQTNYTVGIRVDRITNGSRSLIPLQVFGGILLWL